MNKVLFETGYMEDISGGIQLIVGVAMVVVFYFWAKRNEKEKGEKDAKVFSAVSKGVLIYVMALVLSWINDYKNIVIPYKNGNYVEIVGTVENYSTSLKENVEYFTVDGVRFKCSYGSPSQGYHKQQQKRNEIIISGRHLRIRYIPLRRENVIVYIEQMMPEEWDTD